MTDKTKRFEVLLTRDGSEDYIPTFTWAETRKGAATRVASDFEAHPEVWSGWSFEIK